MADGSENLAPALQQRVRRELQPNESIEWIGQPDPNRMMRAGFVFWLFFTPWTLFACFWIVQAGGLEVLNSTRTGLARFFPLFGLPFLFIGLGGLSAPFWMRRRARSTIYVVTSQRAIEISGRKRVTVRSYLPEQLRDLVRTENADGSGDLQISASAATDGNGNRAKSGFYGVANVREVERKVTALARRPALENSI
jgi:hypothetical protein